MYRTTPRHQPTNVDVQRVSDRGEQHTSSRTASPSGDDSGHGALGFSDLLLDVVEREVSLFADQGNAIRNGFSESGGHLGRGVPVGIAGFGARHCRQRGHVTARMPAERVSSGSGLLFTRSFSHLSKGFA